MAVEYGYLTQYFDSGTAQNTEGPVDWVYRPSTTVKENWVTTTTTNNTDGTGTYYYKYNPKQWIYVPDVVIAEPTPFERLRDRINRWRRKQNAS